MEIRFSRLLLPVALGLVVGAAGAHESTQTDASGAPQSQSGQASPGASTLDRSAMIDVIVGVWGDEGSQQVDAESGRTWSDALRARLQGADLHNLRRAMEAVTFDEMLAVLSGKALSGGDGPLQIGDASADLVYTPVTPCRILDTRVAGGAIPAGTSRGYDVSTWWFSTFEPQGGVDGDCNIPARPAAVAVNLAAVSPASAGYLTAYPHGEDQPLAATVNYPAGGVTSNEVLITVSATGTYDMRVYSHRQSHVVGDIVGYYMAPEATTPDCELVETSVSVAAGGSTFHTSSCPTGYRPQGGGCFWFASQNHGPLTSTVNLAMTGHTCRGTNQTASPQNLYSRATCCRIPGR